MFSFVLPLAPLGIQGLALGTQASLLSLCFMLTGEFKPRTITITADPPKPLEGQSLSLKVSKILNNTVACRWHRWAAANRGLLLIRFLPPLAGKIEGEGFTGREVRKSDCSLHIRDLTVKDSGSYQFTTDGPGIYAEGKMDIVVADVETRIDTRGLSTAAASGIIIGCIVALVVLVAVAYFASRE